ncbi:MAG: sensor domain-containing diguanylate cyclase, partial [Alphaproteobacteria bacterium]
MNSALVFATPTSFFVTLATFLMFYLSSKHAIKDGIVNKALMSCFYGVLLCFLSSMVVNNHGFLSFSVTIIVFIELMLLLLSLTFFVSFATQLLVGSKPGAGVGSLVFVCGLVLVLTFLFLSPDGAMVDKMRSLFPLVGFCYLAVAFWSKSGAYGFSYSLAAIVSSYASLLYLTGLLNLGDVKAWWNPAVVNISLSMAVLMMRSAELSKRIKGLEQSVVRNNQKFKEIIEHSPFPIVISKLSDDKLLIANDNATHLFGIYKQDIDRYKLKDFFADPNARKELAEKLEKERSVKDFEFLSDTQSAFSPFWLLSSASIIEYDMSPALYMAFQDITLRKNKEFMLKDQATKDPLTGIFNRRYFEDEIPQRISNYDFQSECFSVLMLDADHFKNVNDTYGHKTGDAVLIELATISDKALRDSDIVARYGGEEFVMFLDQTDEEQAKNVANRLRESISKIVVKADDGRDVTFTVSIGLCTSHYSTDLNQLVKNADLALYQAKENGRNRVEAYVPDFDVDADKIDTTESHHPIYDQQPEEEISLIEETNGLDTSSFDEPTDLGAPSFEEPTAPAFEEPAVQEYSEPTDLSAPSFAEPTA